VSSLGHCPMWRTNPITVMFSQGSEREMPSEPCSRGERSGWRTVPVVALRNALDFRRAVWKDLGGVGGIGLNAH